MNTEPIIVDIKSSELKWEQDGKNSVGYLETTIPEILIQKIHFKVLSTRTNKTMIFIWNHIDTRNGEIRFVNSSLNIELIVKKTGNR